MNWGIAQSSCGGINYLRLPSTEGFPKMGTVSVETRTSHANYVELFNLKKDSKTLTDICATSTPSGTQMTLNTQYLELLVITRFGKYVMEC